MNTGPHSQIRALVATDKRAAELFVQSQLTPLTKPLPTRALSFSDGSIIPAEGVGAAALHLPLSTICSANLGYRAFHTVYEAQLVGVRMAADLAHAHLKRQKTYFWFFYQQPVVDTGLGPAPEDNPGPGTKAQSPQRSCQTDTNIPHR